MEVVSYDDFMRKVKRVNTFDKVAAGINAGMSAINAGMSSTSTSTSSVTVYVTIGSAVYEFPLTIDFKKNKKNYTWD